MIAVAQVKDDKDERLMKKTLKLMLMCLNQNRHTVLRAAFMTLKNKTIVKDTLPIIEFIDRKGEFLDSARSSLVNTS